MTYRMLSVVVVQAEVEADSPEEAGILFSHMSFDCFSPTSWLSESQLLVQDGKEWRQVDEYTTASLWPNE